MKNIMFSIICPIYNRGHYVDAFIKSILTQTYDNFEVIFVDDGSTDDTSDKIKDFASRNKIIKYFHQQNSGPFLARREAMRHITGEYFIFLDSDDTLDFNALKILNDAITNNCYPDLLYFDFDTEGKHYRNPLINNFEIVSNSSDPVQELFIKTCSYYLWDKCYSKKLIDDAYFDVDFEYGNFAEDTLMVYQLVKKAKSLIKIDKKLYKYNYTPNSLSNVLSRKEHNGLINIYFYIYSDLNKKYIPHINEHLLNYLNTLYRDYLLFNSKTENYKQWKKRAIMFNKVKSLYNFKKMYFKKMKMFYLLYKIKMFYLSYIIFKHF